MRDLLASMSTLTLVTSEGNSDMTEQSRQRGKSPYTAVFIGAIGGAIVGVILGTVLASMLGWSTLMAIGLGMTMGPAMGAGVGLALSEERRAST